MASIFSRGEIPNFVSIIMIPNKNLTQTFKKILNMFFIDAIIRTMFRIESKSYKVRNRARRLRFSYSSKHPFAGVPLFAKSALSARYSQEHRYNVIFAVITKKRRLPVFKVKEINGFRRKTGVWKIPAPSCASHFRYIFIISIINKFTSF